MLISIYNMHKNLRLSYKWSNIYIMTNLYMKTMEIDTFIP